MNITVIGAGYVGLVTGACLAMYDHNVTCIDVNEERIAGLNKGICPIHEPGLENSIQAHLKTERLKFKKSLNELNEHPEIIFIAVGTPSNIEGRADKTYIHQAADDIGKYITKPCIIIDKSTVPVGTGAEVKERIQRMLQIRQSNISFSVVSNPEFLREGCAIQDFMQPERIIIGTSEGDIVAIDKMRELYHHICENANAPLLFMSVEEAEFSKYASNAFLALKISFMNEIAAICAKMPNVNIDHIREGMGYDKRIGPHFLNAGCGYGGSCFPKDVKALMGMAEDLEVSTGILRAVEERNDIQKEYLANLLISLYKDRSLPKVALWGLSFKPNTDDMREAPSLSIIKKLASHNASSITAFDPIVKTIKPEYCLEPLLQAKKLSLATDQYAALQGAKILIIATESDCFKTANLLKIKEAGIEIILDGRNIFDLDLMKKYGFMYYGIGRGLTNEQSTLLKRAVVSL